MKYIFTNKSAAKVSGSWSAGGGFMRIYKVEGDAFVPQVSAQERQYITVSNDNGFEIMEVISITPTTGMAGNFDLIVSNAKHGTTAILLSAESNVYAGITAQMMTELFAGLKSNQASISELSTIIGSNSPLGNFAPQAIGQHYLDTSQSPEKIYISYGLTSLDWKEIGASVSGGSGGGVGISATQHVVMNSSLGSYYDFDPATSDHLILICNGPQPLSYTLNIAPTVIPAAFEVIKSKITVLMGDVTATLSINGAPGIIDRLMFLDTTGVAANSSVPVNVTQTNRLLTFDIEVLPPILFSGSTTHTAVILTLNGSIPLGLWFPLVN